MPLKPKKIFYPIKALSEFIQLESASGIILFSVALLALILDNSRFSDFYQRLFNTNLGLSLNGFGFSASLGHWINNGLMTFFFLLVGLEIKREIIVGSLNSFSKIILPGIAALGGMVMPALIYFIINHRHSELLPGWAIPTATDIAFSLAILLLLSNRVPTSLKIFLTALAIFDDVGAIIIIGIFYSANIYWLALFLALICVLILGFLNYYRVSSLLAYLFVGFLLWLCILKSGVHATIAGVILAFCIPLTSDNPGVSPLRKLEKVLHPWVAYGVLPLFGFANAGISFTELKLEDLLSPLPIGIVAGLFIGKQVGVWSTVWLVVKLGWAKLPHRSTWISLYGISLICGIGFTMSLFIGDLAFDTTTSDHGGLIRFGVLLGSLLSGLAGYLVLRLCSPIMNK